MKVHDSMGNSGVNISPLRFPNTNEIHVWQVRACDIKLTVANDWLSSDEHARSSRFLKVHDRMRFQATRAALRLLIGAYVGISPEDCLFRESIHGKPFLVNHRDTRLEFNVSHSGQYGLIAITNARPVGIDIEKFSPTLDYSEIVALCFSKSERTSLASLPPEIGFREFFRYWTRKEAFMKYLGIGFRSNPEELTATPCADPKTSIRSLAISEGYAAAVATRGHANNIAIRVLPDFERTTSAVQ